MQIYASTTFLGDRPTRLVEVLDRMGDLGLDGIELGSTHVWQPDLAERAAAHCDLPVLTHNYFPPAEQDMVLNIASGDADIRARSIAHMKHCIAIAADLGAKLYTIHPGFLSDPERSDGDPVTRTFDFKFKGGKTPYERAFGLMIAALEDLADAAAQAGVPLAIETEGSLTSAGVTLMETPAEYNRLFEAIPTGLSINLNLAHTSLAATGHGFDMADFIDAARDRIAAVEVSHNDGHADQHLPLEPGAPVLNWIGRLPDVPLILEFRHTDPDAVAASAEILRGLDIQNEEASGR